MFQGKTCKFYYQVLSEPVLKFDLDSFPKIANQSLMFSKVPRIFFMTVFQVKNTAINNVRLQKEIVLTHFFILPDVQWTWRVALKSIKVLFIKNIK